jgi:microcystin-dependent protein
MRRILIFSITLTLFGVLTLARPAGAQECFIGEVRLFAGNFAPRGWAFAAGQLLPISQNQSLFAIVGTTYGGDGRTTFALPDLRGRVPLGTGQGPGLTNRTLGKKGGAETHTLTAAEMPSHNHAVMASNAVGTQSRPQGNVWASHKRTKVYETGGQLVTMSKSAIARTGGNRALDTMQPFLGLNYIICLQGIFPSRN